jgi:hypothetical protein
VRAYTRMVMAPLPGGALASGLVGALQRVAILALIHIDRPSARLALYTFARSSPNGRYLRISAAH